MKEGSEAKAASISAYEGTAVDKCLHFHHITGASVSRPRHPNKEVEAAIAAAEHAGWTVHLSKGHAWGHLYCPLSTREGCIVAVWSTPRNPENHAKGIVRAVKRCPACHGSVNDEKP